MFDVVGTGCAEFLWLPSRSGASHGQRGSVGDLQTRGRRKGQGLGCVNLVATASGRRKDAHDQDSEVGRQLCRLGDEDVSGWNIELAL